VGYPAASAACLHAAEVCLSFVLLGAFWEWDRETGVSFVFFSGVYSVTTVYEGIAGLWAGTEGREWMASDGPGIV